MEIVGLGERWDPDRPWCWADRGEDGWELDLPTDAADEIVAAARAAPRLARGLTVPVVDEDASSDDDVGEQTGPVGRGLSGRPLVSLVTHRTDPLTRWSRALGPIDDDAVAELADAAGVLAVVLSHWLDQAGPDHAEAGDVALWAETASRTSEELLEPLRRRFRPRRDGTFRVRLFAAERELIDRALAELHGALGSDDPSLRRLFPTAYPDDAERQAGWSALVHGELIESRRATIASVRQSIQATTLDASELSALMRGLNDLRLVLGTRLDVGEDGRPAGALDPDGARMLVLHEHLGLLLYDIVAALRTTL